MTTKTKQTSPTTLNTEHIVLWFDDLGTGNEEYNFLSNFHIGDPITLPGVTWTALAKACRMPLIAEEALADNGFTGLIEFYSGEHAFAAMKFWGTDFDHFVNIVNARDEQYTEFNPKTGENETFVIDACNNAKSLGRSRSHPLRPDWEAVKLDVMAAITRAKYAAGTALAERLLATGDRLLVEGTFWADEVWGVDLTKASMPGRNWLGSILMMRRAELKAWFHAPSTTSVPAFVNGTATHNLAFCL